MLLLWHLQVVRAEENDMPAKSKAQLKMMQAAAHNPKFAAKVGIPVKVAQEFAAKTVTALRDLPNKVKPQR